MVVGGRRGAACASFLGLRPLDGWLRLVKAVVNEVGPPLRHLPLSIAQEVSGPPGTLASDAEISGGPISLHTAITAGAGSPKGTAPGLPTANRRSGGRR